MNNLFKTTFHYEVVYTTKKLNSVLFPIYKQTLSQQKNTLLNLNKRIRYVKNGVEYT